MDYTGPRAALAAGLVTAIADTTIEVCDDEPDTITHPLTVVVAWVGTACDKEAWTHTYEVRVICQDLTAAVRADRDELVAVVAGFLLATTITSRRPTPIRPSTATIARAEYPAVIVTTNVVEPAA